MNKGPLLLSVVSNNESRTSWFFVSLSISVCRSGLLGDGKNCSCPIGYHLNEITILCDETNECDQENHCNENAVCYNTVGSYICECDKGLWGDGQTCYEGYIMVLNAPWWVPK